MTDQQTPEFEPIGPEFEKVVFAGPANLVDQIAVLEKDNIIRIAVAESTLSGPSVFRGAVAMSLNNAKSLRDMLTNIIRKAEQRNDA